MELEKKGCYRFLFGFLGFRLSILGFRVQGLRFRGLGVWGVEFKGFRGLRVVIGLRGTSEFEKNRKKGFLYGLDFRIWNLVFRV